LSLLAFWGALHWGGKAYHKWHKWNTSAPVPPPEQAVSTVYTGQAGHNGALSLRSEALASGQEARAVWGATSDRVRLLAPRPEPRPVRRRKVSPWLSFPTSRTWVDVAGQAQNGTTPSQVPSAATCDAVDEALQAFVQRWIDPLFGDTGNRQLQELGVTLHTTAVSPAEQSINRFLALSLVTVGLTLVGVWFFPPLV